MLKLLMQFIRHSPVIAFIKDLDGRYQLVSDTWLSAFATSAEEVHGKTDHDLFEKDKADDFARNDAEVLRTLQPSRRFEDVPVPPNVRTFFSTKFPVFGEDGTVLGLAGFALDLTEQLAVVRDLERQKRFLERTQAVTDVGGWELDGATRTLVWTSEMFRLFGVGEREFRPTFDAMLERFVPEHRQAVARAHEEALARRTPFRLEVELERPGGERRRVRLHGIPEGDPPRLSGALQDVTQEHLLEERLRHSSRMDAVGQLAGGIAHDFNNMLGAITAAAELLRFDTLSEASKEALNVIFNAAQQAAGLTQQLLQFSRKEGSNRVPVDLHEVLDGAVAMLQRTLGRQVEVVVERHATRTVLLGDATQLSSVLVNLAINARDAMPEGGRLTFRTTDEQPGLVRLDVSDTGVGIPPGVIRHIFDPFFTTKERGRGTGLGLATADLTVRAHDGTVTVRSEPGRGTTFELRFPLLPEEALVSSEAAATSHVAGDGKLILVVDDESFVRRTTGWLLGRLGFRVREATDGASALHELTTSAQKPDLVLLDLVMPGLTARDTFFALRQALPQVPVVLCSGFAPLPVLEELATQPNVARLPKPFTLEQLKAALDGLLPPATAEKR